MDNICCISGCERFGSPIVSRHFKVTGNASIFEETAPKEFVYDEYLPEELDGNLKFKGDE
jgi:hypothetical protein